MRKLLLSVCALSTWMIGSLTACTGPLADPLSEGNTSSLPEVSRPNPYPTFRGSDTMSGEKNFALLINNHLEGKVEPTPWAGYWWPYTKNGIASGYGDFMGNSSPAGKYDAARGGTTQAQQWEIRNHGAGVPKVQGWWGHCNGWTAASSLFPEPREAVKVNGVVFLALGISKHS